MKAELYGQTHRGDEGTLSQVLKEFSDETPWNELRISVAYASVAGLLHLLKQLKAHKQAGYTSQWLIGLDDQLTQPGVLRMCLTIPNAELRTARLLGEGR